MSRETLTWQVGSQLNDFFLAVSYMKRSGRLVWSAWLQRGLVDSENIVKWRFDGPSAQRAIFLQG
jgi:hypothetical protein